MFENKSSGSGVHLGNLGLCLFDKSRGAKGERRTCSRKEMEGGNGDVVHVELEKRENYSDFEMIMESSQGEIGR